jgi:hypothetical protein
MTDITDDEAIVRELVQGRTARQIAKVRKMTVPEVNRILDLEVARAFGAEGLRRTVFVEIELLRTLKRRLWDLAMDPDDPQALHAAALYIKCQERLACAGGYNMPVNHVVNVVGGMPEPEEHQSSTFALLESIRRLKEGDPAKAKADDDEDDEAPAGEALN